MKWFPLSSLTPLLVVAHSVMAQIPNPGFEIWSGGNPVGWSTSNDSSFSINVTQTSSSHGGSSAVHGVVTTFGGGFPWSPAVMSEGDGFPVSSRHPALRAWYTFSPVGGDELWLSVGMTQADTGVGAGLFITGTAQATYRELVMNILYASQQIPDTCFLSATILGPGGGLPNVGSAFDLDDLSFGPITGVDDRGHSLPREYTLLQNFPNPFNPLTRIEYAIPHAGYVRLDVYDLLGREVAELINEYQEAGSYRTYFDATELPSGTYFYRLSTGDFSATRKLLLLK